MAFNTLRGRLLLLLAVAMLPMVVLAVFLHAENRERALHDLEKDIRAVMGIAAAEQDHFIDRTHQILRIMARADDTRQLDSPDCAGLVQRLLATQTFYVNLGAADLSGKVVCSGQPGPATSAADLGWFGAALSGGSLTRGYYQVGEIAERPVVTFAYPIADEHGTPRGVLFASADRGWLDQLLAAMRLPAGWTGAIVDRGGRLLARFPAPDSPDGRAPPEAELAGLIRTSHGGGTADLTDADGVAWRYAYSPLAATGEDLFLAIGGETAAVTAPVDRQIYLQLGLIAAVTVLSFLASWFGIHTSLLRWSRNLRAAARRFGAGELEARFESNNKVAELAEIGRAFDHMADDICEREVQHRASEEALRESEARFERAVHGAGEGIWDWDLDSDLVYYSPRFKELLGYAPDDARFPEMFKLRDWLHPEDREEALAAVNRSLESRTPFDQSYRLRRRDGSYGWFRGVGQVQESNDHRYFAGAIHDIGELKQAEEQLRLAARVFESSRESIVVTDANSRILAVNRSFTDITGYTAEEATGRGADLLRSGQHDDAFFAAMWDSIHATGSWQGEIWNRRKDGGLYPAWLSITAVRDTGGQVTHYISIATDITEQRRAEERIRHLAYYDALTGLPNRTLLNDRAVQALASAGRDGQEITVMFIDVDRFKTINDSLGHSVGDFFLQAVAGRIRNTMREVDTVARIGGDEFVIVLPETGAAGAGYAAVKLLAVAGEPYHIGDRHLSATLSIGISVFPEDADTFEALMQHADTAMFRAKETGRNCYRFFRPEMNTAAFERLTMESDLRRALQRREFVVHYQPQMDLTPRRLVGLEALIRWNDPDSGTILPGKFIPVAENSGLIVPIGEWVLTEACRQAKAWQDAGLPALPVAVNLSAHQFRHGGLEETVARALQESGLEPQYLELELTEGIVMEDSQHTLATLKRLKDLGVHLSIDDFGTGYSSLSYLKRFPIDKLKIDQSFVRDITTNPDDLAIASAVIHMGHSLRLKVMAEGTETAEQLEILSREGCDQAQGYHFGRPMPADATGRLLARAA